MCYLIKQKIHKFINLSFNIINYVNQFDFIQNQNLLNIKRIIKHSYCFIKIKVIHIIMVILIIKINFNIIIILFIKCHFFIISISI